MQLYCPLALHWSAGLVSKNIRQGQIDIREKISEIFHSIYCDSMHPHAPSCD